MQFSDRCAPVEVSSSAEYSVLAALQLQVVSVRRVLPGGTGVSCDWPNQSYVNPKFYICTSIWTLSFESRMDPYVRAQGHGCGRFDVILLSKVAPIYVTLLTKGLSRPFNCSTSSGTLKSSGEIDRLNFPFIEKTAGNV
jgi:hypothetical protein